MIISLPYYLSYGYLTTHPGTGCDKEMTEMSTAVVDSPQNEQAQAWWFLDTLVVEHRCAPGMDTVVLEMTLPVGSAPPLHIHDGCSKGGLQRRQSYIDGRAVDEGHRGA